MYDSLEERMADYQREIQRKMDELRCEQAGHSPFEPVENKEKAKAIKRRGQEPMRRVLPGMTGVDLITIDGIGAETAERAVRGRAKHCGWQPRQCATARPL